MKHFIIQISKWVLGLLGLTLTGCSIENIRCEYGVPHAEYEIKGKVIDSETKNAVQGVSLTLHESHYNHSLDIDVPSDYTLDSTVVNHSGEFTLNGGGFPNDYLFIKVKDIDSQTDGNYIEKIVKVSFQQTEEGSGYWDNGTFASDVIIELAEHKSQEQ